MNWNRKTVLVTGADGFIGSHLVERLVKLGAKVRALVYYNAFGSRGWLDHLTSKSRMEIVMGDIRDQSLMTRIMKNVDVVFHLAALIGIPYSFVAPESYVQTNVQGTLNLLHAAKDENVERFIHTSTSEVYGTAQYVPIDEKHPLHPQSPYAATKVAADKLVESFYLSFALPSVILRPFNTYGPRQSTRAVIPSIIMQCLSGNTIRLGNLKPTRDLNFVSDIVDGFLLAAKSPRAVGQCIHLGSGKEISIENLAHLIAKLMKKKIRLKQEEKRLRSDKSEVGQLLADPAMAEEFLGWKSKYSLEQGLTLTINWFKKNAHKYHSGGYEL